MTDIHQMLLSEYTRACSTISDINHHLPLLHDLANRCSHVTEFGVRTGESSRAILSSRANHVRMYDIQQDTGVSNLVNLCQQAGKDVVYRIQDVLSVQIELTELLFIDTLHTYAQLKAELERHSWRTSRFIAFHDTHTFGICDEPGYTGPGLLPAIMEFIAANPQWQVMYHTPVNNGFTVLHRRF